MLIPYGKTYEEVHSGFRWAVPARYNVARDVCERHAGDRSKVALIHEDADGTVRGTTFADVEASACRLANVLTADGLKPGDRVLLLLTQDPLTAIAHIACWKAGFVSIPTSILFGPDAIAYRLRDSGASIIITDLARYPVAAEARTASANCT